MNLHYSQTRALVAASELLFENPMNLHYSQTERSKVNDVLLV